MTVANGKTKYSVIGTRPIRHDGVDKVTGRAQYGNDIQLSGMIVGKILRSPHAHARIKKLDVSKAAKAEGVFAIATAADFPDHENSVAELGEGSVNLRHLSDNCLARDKVLYKGHAVAAVAARTIHLAEAALALIDVEYEPLPSILDVEEAIKPGAPLVHPGLFTQKMGKAKGKSSEPSNIASEILFEKGNLAESFAKADIVIERTFRTATVHQGYIEPHAATAFYNSDGSLHVWSSTQGSFTCRDQTASLLGMPISKVTVTPTEIGGGFGGKIRVYLEPVAAILSKKSGRPVKLAMTRTECFESTGPTPGAFVTVKIGATKDGKLIAGDGMLAYDAGAFPSGIVNMGAMCLFSCYEFESARVVGLDVCVNKPNSAAYRAPGATVAALGCETIIDEIADKLKMDPLELRIKNAAKEGTRRVDGPTYPRIGLIEAIEAIKNHPHYKSPISGPNRGRGVAVGYWFNIGLKSSATAHVNADGTITLIEGSTDIGGTRTSSAMQLAETLGIPAEDVLPSVASTDGVGYTDVTGGSRVTFATGWACYEAGMDIKLQAIERAAKIWGCPSGDINYDHGNFVKSDGSAKLTFKELCAKLQETGGLITGRASVNPHGSGGAFACHLVDLEVDPETGKVTILRYTASQDVGTAIHPSYVEGQIQGGVAQGVGWALNEEYFYDKEGRQKNASYLDYRMPTCCDLPMIDAVIVEVPNPGHPFGVRGVGEVPIVPPPAAVANAISHAIGHRMTELPMSPGKICQAMGLLGN